MKSTIRKYDVTLRRDVQQKCVLRVEASSRQDAIDTAEAVSEDIDGWRVEDHIGTHRPEVVLAWKTDAARGRAYAARDRSKKTRRIA